MASGIHFHIEEIEFKIPHPLKTKKWLSSAAEKEGFSIKEINYIFCSDVYLLQINKEYLNHNYLTDIITFDNSEEEGLIESDIFISIDRVKDNSIEFQENFERELKRVMIHGLLHLIGYGDKSPKEKIEMRKREEAYLSLFPN
jgi:rRNA maturation RNase YbeY